MNVKNKLWRVAGIAAAAVGISGLSMAGVASASTAQPVATTTTAALHAGFCRAGRQRPDHLCHPDL